MPEDMRSALEDPDSCHRSCFEPALDRFQPMCFPPFRSRPVTHGPFCRGEKSSCF
ncbi:hypothetical protein EV356DRAFT_503458 [Viridothelium virens]|uniref:Uncharacterized protein n=1 Tax=Viridothelium virens TaxID=1048519 RepID=A0A6A6H809_VIRVR|nr:hypothetical protein EV356DRAFT_503458 [Viridothelium virens]